MPRKAPKPLQQFRGTTAQHSAYTGLIGEITVDTTKNTAVIQDGVTAGGHPLAKESTTITASNGVEISAGGTLGQNTTVSGVAASTTAPGVVQLSSSTTGTSEAVAATEKAVADALQAAKDYADTAAGALYTGTAPIAVDASTRVISASDATAAAKGVVQVGDNVTVSNGTISVKPWTDSVVSHTTVNVADYQEGAIIVTDEAIAGATAVIAEVEDTLSGSVNKVPSSYAVTQGVPAIAAHAAMPSEQFEELAIPESGGTVTAPADGYFCLGCTFSAVGQTATIYLFGGSLQTRIYSAVARGQWRTVLPISQGASLNIEYSSGVTTDFLRFTYANGSATA